MKSWFRQVFKLGVSCVAAAGAALGSAGAAIVVDGVSDESEYPNSATFTVQAEAGYDTTALLNGAPAPVGAAVTVTRPNYYELDVSKRRLADGVTEMALIQFVVRDPARGDGEIGLSSWVPYPTIP